MLKLYYLLIFFFLILSYQLSHFSYFVNSSSPMACLAGFFKLGIFWTCQFSVVGGSPTAVEYLAASLSLPTTCQSHSLLVTTKNASRHCEMYPWWRQTQTQLRSTALEPASRPLLLLIIIIIITIIINNFLQPASNDDSIFPILQIHFLKE